MFIRKGLMKNKIIYLLIISTFMSASTIDSWNYKEDKEKHLII